MTRGRPYKKDDNAHVEQKNWTHVRKLLGWERYDTPTAVAAINDLYRNELRRWLNLYLPSVKLMKKVRVGSKLRRVYAAPQTPFERVWACTKNPADLAELKKFKDTIDPFRLGEVIERKLEVIYELAQRRYSPAATKTNARPAVTGTNKHAARSCGKAAREKSQQTTFPPRLEIPHRTRDFHFPTATTAAGLHYK